MDTLVCDFETFFSVDYSLKKMATLDYIRDPQFKAHGAACKLNGEPAQWVRGVDLQAYFDSLDWSNILLISHNSNFDNTILFDHYGVSPAKRADTIGVCRTLLPQDLDFDLDTICSTLGIEGKLDGGAALDATRGIRDLTPKLEADLAKYAIQDADAEYALFCLLYPSLPEDEQDLLDIFIRMSTEGALLFDTSLADECQADILAERRRRLEAAGLTINSEGKVPELSSAEKFAELLRARGVEPPMKLSPAALKKGEEKWIYAFSKQDPEFVQLRNHPEVAHLVEAKLTWSSRSELKRVEKLARIAGYPPHTIPVQLNYSGAHTLRPSGGGGINMQNLNRGSKLRLALHAPPGSVIIVVDLSQIELRVNMDFSGQDDLVELLRPGEYQVGDNSIEWKGADIYRRQASEQFQCALEAVSKDQRNFGKVAELMLGFGAGDKKFRATCAVGPMGAPPILISAERSYNAVQTYRRNRGFVKASWAFLQHGGIPYLMEKGEREHKYVVFEKGAVRLPNGTHILYPGLHYGKGDEANDVFWGLNGYQHKIYGGKLQENIVQALAQVICKYFMLQLHREFGALAPIVHQVHDEVLLLCPERDAAQVLQRAIEIMSSPPPWCPDLPVRAEGGFDYRYSK